MKPITTTTRKFASKIGDNKHGNIVVEKDKNTGDEEAGEDHEEDEEEEEEEDEEDEEEEDEESEQDEEENEDENKEESSGGVEEEIGTDGVVRQDNRIYFYGAITRKNVLGLRRLLHQCVALHHTLPSLRLKLVNKKRKLLRSTIKSQKRAIKQQSKTVTPATTPRKEKAEVVRMRAELCRLRGQLAQTTKRKERLCNAMHEVSSQACSNLTKVYIFIHSMGGDSDVGLLAYDIVRRCPLLVHTVIDGICASAATLLFLAGDQRSMAANATMMIHEAQAINACGTTAHIQADLENLHDATDKIVNIYVQHSKMSRKRIKKEMQTDRAWTRDETVALGFLTRDETPF